MSSAEPGPLAWKVQSIWRPWNPRGWVPHFATVMVVNISSPSTVPMSNEVNTAVDAPSHAFVALSSV